MSRHPAFRLGMEAFIKGDMNNPNKKDTIAWKEFQAGFDHQYFLNLKSNQHTTKEV